MSSAVAAYFPLNAADEIDIVDPESGTYYGAKADSEPSFAEGLVVNINTTKPNNDDPAAALIAVQSRDIASSNMSESGGAADPSKRAVVINMNGGALTSLKAVAGAANIYGTVEINVNGGLIQDSSSGVGAIIGSSNLASNAHVWGNSDINIGNSLGDPQPTVSGSILGFAMGTLHGNTNIVINGGTFSASSSSTKGIFAGANWNGVIEGDTNITVKDGIVSCIIAGGNANTKSGSYATIKGSSNVTIEGGSLYTVYSGNYATAGLASLGGKIERNANMKISGGSMGVVYGGGGTVGGNVSTEISGGEMDIVYAAYGNVGGATKLHITGGSMNGIYGTYQGTTDGDVEIVIEKASITGDITGARAANSKGDGNVSVTFVGNASDVVFGADSEVKGRDTAAAKSGCEISLSFGDSEKAFNGAFGAKISDFDLLSVSGGSDAAFDKEISGVSALSVKESSALSLSGGISAAFDKISISSDSRVNVGGAALALNEGGVLEIFLSDFSGDFLSLSEMIVFSDNDGKFWGGLTKDNVAVYHSDGTILDSGEWEFSSAADEFGIIVNIPEPAMAAALLAAAALAAPAMRRRS